MQAVSISRPQPSAEPAPATTVCNYLPGEQPWMQLCTPKASAICRLPVVAMACSWPDALHPHTNWNVQGAVNTGCNVAPALIFYAKPPAASSASNSGRALSWTPATAQLAWQLYP